MSCGREQFYARVYSPDPGAMLGWSIGSAQANGDLFASIFATAETSGASTASGSLLAAKAMAGEATGTSTASGAMEISTPASIEALTNLPNLDENERAAVKLLADDLYLAGLWDGVVFMCGLALNEQDSLTTMRTNPNFTLVTNNDCTHVKGEGWTMTDAVQSLTYLRSTTNISNWWPTGQNLWGSFGSFTVDLIEGDNNDISILRVAANSFTNYRISQNDVLSSFGTGSSFINLARPAIYQGQLTQTGREDGGGQWARNNDAADTKADSPAFVNNVLEIGRGTGTGSITQAFAYGAEWTEAQAIAARPIIFQFMTDLGVPNS